MTRALLIYDHIRRPFSHKVQERARLNGQYFTLNCKDIDFDSVPECELIPKLRTLGQIFTKNWEWVWTTSMGPSVGEAIRLLETIHTQLWTIFGIYTRAWRHSPLDMRPAIWGNSAETLFSSLLAIAWLKWTASLASGIGIQVNPMNGNLYYKTRTPPIATWVSPWVPTAATLNRQV